MNIKKIIKEEVDDLNWMDDINPKGYGDPNKIFLTVDIYTPVRRYVDKLEDNGYRWIGTSMSNYNRHNTTLGLVINPKTKRLVRFIDKSDLNRAERIGTGIGSELTLMYDLIEKIPMKDFIKNLDKGLSESDDLGWMDDVVDYDTEKPQVGYVYQLKGYSSWFNDVDGDGGPPSDNIVVKYVIPDGDNEGVGFDTVPPYWGSSHLDEIGYSLFIEKMNTDKIVFLYKEDENINESDDLDWIRDVQSSVPFLDLIIGKYYVISNVNGELVNDSFDNCSDRPNDLDDNSSPLETEEYLNGKIVKVTLTQRGISNMSNCVGSDIVNNVHLVFEDNAFTWWFHEGMLELTLNGSF